MYLGYILKILFSFENFFKIKKLIFANLIYTLIHHILTVETFKNYTNHKVKEKIEKGS